MIHIKVKMIKVLSTFTYPHMIFMYKVKKR